MTAEEVAPHCLNRLMDLCKENIDALSRTDKLVHSAKVGLAQTEWKDILKTLRELPPNEATPSSIRKLILGRLITQETRSQIGAFDASLLITEAEIKSFTQEACIESIPDAELVFEDGMNGANFYEKVLKNQSKNIFKDGDEKIDFRLKNLCLQFKHISTAIQPLVYLLYGLMDQPPHERVETIKHWLKSFAKKKENLTMLQRFLGVFGDISSYVSEKSSSEKELIDRSQVVLSAILEDKKLTNSDNFNPFEILKSYLAQADGTNPWLIEEPKNTPFDIHKIESLVDPKVPRQLLARSLAGLNQYTLEITAQKAEAVVRQYKSYQSLRKSGKEVEAQALEKKIHKSLDALLSTYKNFPGPGAELTAKMAFLRQDVLAKRQWIETKITGSEGDVSTFHPLMIMIRVIDPEIVVSNPEPRRQFIAMIKGLEPLIESIYSNTEDQNQQEECGAALARSVELLLNQENPYLDVPLRPDQKLSIREIIVQDVVKHIPADIRENGAYARFKNKAHTQKPTGPLLIPPDSRIDTSNHFDSAGIGVRREWIIAVARAWKDDIQRSSPDAEKAFSRMLQYATDIVTKYYNAQNYSPYFYSSATDGAIDIFPKMILHESAPDDYIIGSNQEYGAMVDEAIKVLERESPKKQHNAYSYESDYTQNLNINYPDFKIGPEFLVAPEHGLSANDYAPNLSYSSVLNIPISPTENVSPPEEEGADGLTYNEIESDTPLKKAEFFELNHESGKAKNAQDVFGDIERIVERRGLPPRMIFLSTKTRYGDAACINDGPEKSNFRGLSELIKKIRSTYPTICIALDGCQSFGRNDAGESMCTMNPDLFYNSAGKALGIHNSATMLVRNDFHGYPQPENDRRLDLKGTRSTVNIEDVLAMSLAMKMRMGRVNTRMHPVLIPEKSSLRIVESSQLRESTSHLLTELENFGIEMALEIAQKYKAADEDDTLSTLEESLTPEVVYPQHRKERDFNGIVCVGFPGIRGGRLSKLLSDKVDSPSTVIACLKNSDSIRISFLPEHTTDDVERLISTIKLCIMDEADRQIRSITPQGTNAKNTDIKMWIAQKLHPMPVWEK